MRKHEVRQRNTRNMTDNLDGSGNRRGKGTGEERMEGQAG